MTNLAESTSEILKAIKNPTTQKTLYEEDRIVESLEKNNQLYITYKRDGIDAAAKRDIENTIITAFKDQYEEDAVFVKTISDNHNHAKGPSPSDGKSQEKAELKVGHGSIGNKKKIAGVGKLIAVSSCKGGVGKSTVAVNLAIALKLQGNKVGIIDADIYGPSLPTLLNQRDQKPRASEDKKILPIEINGLKFISFGLFIPESDPVIWRGPMLGGVLNQFLFDTDWGELDYLLVDLPPGTGDIQLSLIQNVELHGALVISTPQQIALLDTKKGLNMFRQMNIPVLGMIENMSYFTPDDAPDKKYYIFGQGGVKRVCEELDIPLLGEIPLETNLRKTSDEGSPYMNNQVFKDTPVWKSYLDISRKVDDKVQVKSSGGFFKRLIGK